MQTHKELPLHYHNLRHTKKVVSSAKLIMSIYQLSDREVFVIVVSCWFHDIGQYEALVNHELASASRAEAILKNNDVDEAAIQMIKNCIMATKLPQAPHNLAEQIVCDADLFHLGTEDFLKQSVLLKQECEELHKVQIKERDWWNATISLMENHYYHTSYCRDMLNTRKHYNLENLKQMVESQNAHSRKTLYS